MNTQAQNAQASGALQVNGLCKSFGGIHAVRDISFNVKRGEIVGLIGPNGAGKTTCFNLITGFYAPSSGTVHFDEQEVTGEKPYSMARSPPAPRWRGSIWAARAAGCPAWTRTRTPDAGSRPTSRTRSATAPR